MSWNQDQAMKPSAHDEIAIRAIIKEQQEAWNRGDAERLAARFHEQGSFTNVRGDFCIGAEAFKERHDLIFQTIFKGSEHALNIQRLHFPTQHVAIVDIEAAVTGYQGLPPGILASPDNALRTRLMQVMVKDDRGWWIVAYHNVDIKPVAVESQS
jgi:uncharacterized protein (TIGR02246 family)